MLYLIDTNVLLSSVNQAATQHRLAKSLLEKIFSEDDVGMSWNALLGFLRISTKQGIVPEPLTAMQALAVLDTWLTHPSCQILEPTPAHAGILGRLLLGAGTAGNLVSDAHLAALAIEHQATLCSFDRDFKRFTGLQLQLLT
jgi:uncharacterized protein